MQMHCISRSWRGRSWSAIQATKVSYPKSQQQLICILQSLRISLQEPNHGKKPSILHWSLSTYSVVAFVMGRVCSMAQRAWWAQQAQRLGGLVCRQQKWVLPEREKRWGMGGQWPALLWHWQHSDDGKWGERGDGGWRHCHRHRYDGKDG